MAYYGGGDKGGEEFKIFVGGLSWSTNEEVLRQHFEKYGGVAR